MNSIKELGTRKLLEQACVHSHFTKEKQALVPSYDIEHKSTPQVTQIAISIKKYFKTLFKQSD
jgi:hypothetical protein